MSNHQVFLFAFLAAALCTILFLRDRKTISNLVSKPPKTTAPTIDANSASVPKPAEKSQHAAVLVAGSHGYENYRHQADMCHAFQLLKKNGIPVNNIITFIYDDLVDNPRNLVNRGKLFNRPNGKDVYPGCAKDYTGKDVNKKVLTAVLNGDVNYVKTIGSGRVLKKDPNQRVFFAYSDHGMPGMISFPIGGNMYADEFNKMIMKMVENSMFHEMVMYIESCFAGSMCQGFPLANEKKVLVVAASNAKESSYATYCPKSVFKSFFVWKIIPEVIGTCLGDLFTVSWIEDSEKKDAAKQTLKDQFKTVKQKTSAHGSYEHGSHVVKYGDPKSRIMKQMIGNFLGGAAKQVQVLWALLNPFSWSVSATGQYQQTDADLAYFEYQHYWHQNEDTAFELQQELEMRKRVDEAIFSSLEKLNELGELPSNVSLSQFARNVIPSMGPNEPIVSDWDCLRGMVSVWEDHCGKLTSYAGQYAGAFVNMCNAGLSPASFRNVLSC